MSAVVSVIIVCDEENCLQRCKNSVERQTYAEKEIFVVDKKDGYQKVNKAISDAKGDYYFFVDSTANITKNTLERLVDIAKNDKSTLACTTIYKKEENSFVPVQNQFSLFGKLFCKEIMQNAKLTQIADYKFGEYEFVAKYLKNVSRCVRDSVSGLYESAEIYADMAGENGYINSLCNGLFAVADDLKAVPIVQDNKTISVSYDVFNDLQGMNQVLITRTEWPVPSEEEIEKKAQSIFKEMMAANIEELTATKEELAVLREQCGYVQDNQRAHGGFVEPEGYMLSEYVIGKFAKGELGMKTVFKAFSAWMKYKLGRK